MKVMKHIDPAPGMHPNTLLRAKTVCEITARYYEPERAARCFKWVWRKHIYPMFPISYRTYLRYLKQGNIGDMIREKYKCRCL